MKPFLMFSHFKRLCNKFLKHFAPAFFSCIGSVMNDQIQSLKSEVNTILQVCHGKYYTGVNFLFDCTPLMAINMPYHQHWGKEWPSGVGYAVTIRIRSILVQTPLGAPLNFGTQPGYEAPGDLWEHRVSECSTVVQTWQWGRQAAVLKIYILKNYQEHV